MRQMGDSVEGQINDQCGNAEDMSRHMRHQMEDIQSDMATKGDLEM
jgi:hypothetical protein